MTQFIIAGLIALALATAIWKYGDHMADAREIEVRAAYAAKAEEQKKEDEAKEKVLRDWALQLSRNYLAFGSNQEKFFTGVRNDLVSQIANDPNLRRACFDAIGVHRFNGEPTPGDGGTGATTGSRDERMPRGSSGPAR